MWTAATQTFASDPLPGGRLSRLGYLADPELVARARSGCHDAFGELVSRYQDPVFSLVYGKIHQYEDALDLTQETFLRAHRRLAEFRGQAAFSTWLYRIAVNICIDHGRWRRRRQPPISLETELLGARGYEPPDPSLQSAPEGALVNKELGRTIGFGIRSLPEVLKRAIILHDLMGLSQEETAAVLGCPLGTAKSRIRRARLQMQGLIRDYLVAD